MELTDKIRPATKPEAMEPETRLDLLLAIISEVTLMHANRPQQNAHYTPSNGIEGRYHQRLLQCAEALEKYGYRGAAADMKEMLGIE